MADIDLQAKLKELLADPTALSGIMNLVMNMSPPKTSPTSENTPINEPPDIPSVEPAQTQPELADSTPVFSRQSHDSPTLPVLSAHGNDSRCALLYALKPYLAPQRAEKIDTMIKLMQITELTRTAFGNKN